MPPDLLDLLDYFTPLADTRHEGEGGVVTLLAPGTNVLALNAAYLPEGVPGVGRSAPLSLCAHSPGKLGPGKVVAGIRLVTLDAEAPEDPEVLVEQVSRLHLPEWCRVLAAAHGTPEWAEMLAVHFARVLEPRRDYALLLAYRRGEAVGAALWRPTGTTRSAVHLWGATDAEVQQPLLTAARTLHPSPLRYTELVPHQTAQLWYTRLIMSKDE